MFQFLHAADVHLDSPLVGLERYEGAPVEQFRHATRRAWENLVALALQQRVALVVVAGDLYDGDWKDFHTGLFLVGQLRKLRDAKIPAVIVAGNHDAANRMTRQLNLPDNVRMLAADRPESVTYDDIGVAVHGQSFARQAVSENLAAGYPPPVRGLFNIGLLHTSLSGREGHEPYAPCTIEDLRVRGYDYWALGHVHTRETAATNPAVHFPGNLQGRNVRETGPKGCSLVTVDGHDVRIEPRWLDVLRWEVCRVDATGMANADDVVAEFARNCRKRIDAAEGRPLAVRVEIVGASAAHRELAAEPQRIAAEIRSAAADVGPGFPGFPGCQGSQGGPGEQGGVWVEQVRIRSSTPAEVDASAWTDGPLGELLECARQWKDSPQAVDLLKKSAADLLDRLPQEVLQGESPLCWEKPENVRAILEQVEQSLFRQLLAREGAA